jgi:glucose-1-phosphate thymidylyltransferase
MPSQPRPTTCVRKGILLAGGVGTRLYPLTAVTSKQLLPIYDKPMIYYPLSTLMLGGIDSVLLISTPRDLPNFRAVLGDGSQFGVKLSYAEQPEPEGIAQAFLIGREFLAEQPVCLILGDNIFYGGMDVLRDALTHREGATIFGYPVRDPQRYGVVEADAAGKVLSIEEKPKQPRSNLAVAGIYVYDGEVSDRAATLRPSGRGELEITDLNLTYLGDGKLRLARLGRGVAWLDAGTFDSRMEASQFVATIERRQSLKIGCPEEAALRMGFVTVEEMEQRLQALPETDYRAYVEAVCRECRDRGGEW